MARYQLPVIGNANNSQVPIDTANSASAAVMRDVDNSINVGQANVAAINNSGADFGAIKTVTGSTYTVLSTDRTLLCDGTSAAMAVAVPAAAGCQGRKITFKRMNSGSNAITLQDATANTEGASTLVLGSQYAKATIQSDGTNWWSV